MPQCSHDDEHAQLPDIDLALAALRAGEVIAIPTDTVYGLAASLERPDAIEQLYEIKGRDATKAIPVLVDDLVFLSHLEGGERDIALALAGAFWPGPLTIVVTSPDAISDVVHRGARTVGLRMPDHPIARAVIAGIGGGLAVTSANRSGEPEALTASDVRRALGDVVSVVVDGGRTHGGQASTVVDLTSGRPLMLRRGLILSRDITQAIADLDIEE